MLRPEAALIALGGLFSAGALFQILNWRPRDTAVAWTIKLLTDKAHAVASDPAVMPPFAPPQLVDRIDADPVLATRSAGFKIEAAAMAAERPALSYWVDNGPIVPSTINAKMYYFANVADWPDKGASCS